MRPNRASIFVALALTASASAAACKRASDDAAESLGAETEVAEAPEEPIVPPTVIEVPADGSGGAATTWTHQEPQTTAQLAMSQAGEHKRTELARGLLGALTAASAGGDYVAAVTACQLRAPEITGAVQGVAGPYAIHVGRTSDRLRNPANVAPAWAAAALQTEDPVGTWLADDAVGLLSPIPAGALCLNCHGTPERLAPGVVDAIAALYPDDAAVGYAEGDVRGWFWVEVRPGG